MASRAPYVVPALKKHTATVIMAHGLGDRFVNNVMQQSTTQLIFLLLVVPAGTIESRYISEYQNIIANHGLIQDGACAKLASSRNVRRSQVRLSQCAIYPYHSGKTIRFLHYSVLFLRVLIELSHRTWA